MKIAGKLHQTMNRMGKGKKSAGARFRDVVRSVSRALTIRKKLQLKKDAHHKKEDECSLFEKISLWIEKPFAWMLYFTALPTTEEEYDW